MILILQIIIGIVLGGILLLIILDNFDLFLQILKIVGLLAVLAALLLGLYLLKQL
jgi:hypothetical protein